jgi:hypothetical protein
MRGRIALPERIAQHSSPRVFRFAEAFGVCGRPRLPFHRLVRALTDETILSKLRNQTRSWPARATHVLTYAS